MTRPLQAAALVALLVVVLGAGCSARRVVAPVPVEPERSAGGGEAVEIVPEDDRAGGEERAPGSAAGEERASGGGPAPEPSWIWPIDGQLSSNFGAREAGSGWHGGLDIRAPAGTPVRAAKSGFVTSSGREGHYGILVVIDHGRGTTSWYGHLASALVRAGDWVEQGAMIGRCGRTGNATGTHLHFEIRQDDVPLDPLPALVPPDRAGAVRGDER